MAVGLIANEASKIRALEVLIFKYVQIWVHITLVRHVKIILDLT
jgi:hypothetical protein